MSICLFFIAHRMLKKTALVKLKLAGFKHFTQRYVFMGLHKAGRSAES